MSLRRIARRLLGPVYDPLQRTWSAARFHTRRILADRQRRRVWRALTRDGVRVQSGPFAGMRYIEQPAEGSVYPKLAGTYEAELNGVIDSITATPYDAVVDIGAAEGYYAVGLAMRMPATQIHAFDVDPASRRLCAELARTNGVADRVSVHGAFDAAELPPGRVLVICDCEGCEREVLDPALFRTADLLVELHEFLDPGITQTLVERFRPTHRVTLIDTLPRDLQLPVLQRLARRDRAFAVDERRPAAMQWGWFVAREES